MRGLKAKNLSAIVDFIYYGEVNISDTDITDFLAAANEFQLKGVVKTSNDSMIETMPTSVNTPRLG